MNILIASIAYITVGYFWARRSLILAKAEGIDDRSEPWMVTASFLMVMFLYPIFLLGRCLIQAFNLVTSHIQSIGK